MKKTIILCSVSALLGAVAAIVMYDPPQTDRQTVAQETGRWAAPVGIASRPEAVTGGLSGAEAANYEGLTPEERVNVAVYQNANRSTANINTRSIQPDMLFTREITSEGEGSGTVIDRRGHVLTNFHVIDGAREVHVTLYNGKTFDARLVGVDPATDVAVLKIDAPEECLFPVAFGNSTGLMGGQRVFAIGNPFGLERTLTTGIVSSLNRSIPARSNGRTLRSIIQTDAAINPGSSGGPLLDSHGRMIGMNTAIASRTGASAGVGVAIPVNTIARVIPQLIENGRVIRPDIGIARVYQPELGLLIATLEPGGPAAKAGLRGPRLMRRRKRQGPIVYEYQTVDRSAADLIVAADGQKIHTGDDLLTIIEGKEPGDELVVTVIRDGKELRVPVSLGSGE